MTNNTETIVFIFLGLSDDPKLQVVIFIFLFITYTLSITGNLTIITLTLLYSHLQNPMYFFLRNFSVLEISFTTPTITNFLGAIISGDKNISFNNCITQLFFLILFGEVEFYLLAMMSYHHWIAICKPLHYLTIMSQKVCTMLVFACCLVSFLSIFPVLMLVLHLDYCGSNIIDCYICDYFSLLQLSCSDSKFLERMGFSCAVFILMSTSALIFWSYTYIIRTILKIPCASQRTKAFSTCFCHMIVISISHGSCIFMYIKLSAAYKASLTKRVAISVVPMLNPFIYNLSNQQVRQAVMNMARKMVFFTSP